MNKTFKSLSVLLCYPSRELQEAAHDIIPLLRKEGRLRADRFAALEALCRDLSETDLIDVEEEYVLLFDRTNALSLNLFEHIHGDSRDRGQAMIDLGDLYRQSGFHAGPGELPDFLPLFLEFLSLKPWEEACALLTQTAHILVVLCERLEKRGSPYAAVFCALLDLADGAHDAEAADILRKEEKDDNPLDLVALDARWEEAPVTFGPETDGVCPKAERMVRAMSGHGMGSEPGVLK